ncbi:MAG: class I SAM-dependent methyltransferase [Chloroflexi bacterium]|nr:MAG: class I SAM-dependent methyltransferase [Chloroflexota bacterium]
MQQPISEILAVQNAQGIRPLSEINERECLARLASAVPAGGTIMEIGCLYGGTTGVLALANPQAQVMAVDNFSWHPPDDIPTSAALVRENMKLIGAGNVDVIEGDSCVLGKFWHGPIDLLWVDGGHTFEIAYADLSNFGPHAQVIAVHDYHNGYWAGVKQAVTKFLEEHAEFKLVEVVHWVAVLRRKA